MTDRLAGTFLIIIGVVILLFGSTTFGKDRAHEPGSRTLPRWLDSVIKWAMALPCLWFGVELVFGIAHF